MSEKKSAVDILIEQAKAESKAMAEAGKKQGEERAAAGAAAKKASERMVLQIPMAKSAIQSVCEKLASLHPSIDGAASRPAVRRSHAASMTLRLPSTKYWATVAFLTVPGEGLALHSEKKHLHGDESLAFSAKVPLDADEAAIVDMIDAELKKLMN